MAARAGLPLIGPHKLTRKQAKVYRFIAEFFAENLRSPSYREVMAEFGFTSTNAVYVHLLALERKGVIRGGDRSRGVRGDSRAIELVGIRLRLAVAEAVAEQVAKVLGHPREDGRGRSHT